MMTWYCVTTAYDDAGHVTSGVTDTRESERQPENTTVSTATKDIYCDWFGSRNEAEAYVEEARRA